MEIVAIIAILVLVCNQLDFETSMFLSELDSIND